MSMEGTMSMGPTLSEAGRRSTGQMLLGMNHPTSPLVGNRAADQKFFMGTYGTFKMDTIHGRLFELQVYIESLKMHMYFYFAFIIITVASGPFAGLLAIPVAHLAGDDKDLQMFKIILVAGFLIFVALWTFPGIVMAFSGGPWHFAELILTKKELNFLDFVDFVACELMLLLVGAFSWVFHEINLDHEKYKDATKASWRSRHAEYGHQINLDKGQAQRISSVVNVASVPDVMGRTETFVPSPRSDLMSENPSVFIEDVVCLLELVPGWLSRSFDVVADHMYDHTYCEKGLYSSLTALSEEASDKNVWPLDIYMVRDQYYSARSDPLLLWIGLKVGFWQLVDMIQYINNTLWFDGNPVTGIVITLLSFFRSMIPRFWLSYMNGGYLWPPDTFGAAGLIVLYSTIVTFLGSLLMMGLCYFVFMEYRRNVAEMTIVSSIVDATMRVRFSQFHLMSFLWFGLDSEQSEEALQKIPLIDLRDSSNVAAFWRIREYANLDRCNERMSVSVLLEILILWLLLKFIATVVTLFRTGTLPAVMAVTLFDLLVFGGMILLSLQTALQLNALLEQHKRVFVEAKYQVTMVLGNLLAKKKDDPDSLMGFHGSDSGSDSPYSSSRQADVGITMEELAHKTKEELNPKILQEDLELSRRLLTEYLDMGNNYDVKDRILLGQTVTPGKIVSSAVTVAAMVASLLAKAMANGQIKQPPAVENLSLVATVSARAGEFLWRHMKNA